MSCAWQVYQERAKASTEAGDEEARLEALLKWIQAAEQSGDQSALAQAHMQMGLAYQQQVCIGTSLWYTTVAVAWLHKHNISPP